MPEFHNDPRQVVRALVECVTPLNEREIADQRWMLDWVDSGAPLVPPVTRAIRRTAVFHDPTGYSGSPPRQASDR